MRRELAAALCLSLATAALASEDDAPPRVELPLGPYVRPGRPVDVRVIGGADRVRAPGTPWALPVGERGDEFLLQMPAAVVSPLDLTVERGGRTDRVTMAVTVLPADAVVAAASEDTGQLKGTVTVPVRDPDPPVADEAWRLFDIAAFPGPRSSTGLLPPPGDAASALFEPFTRGADPELFAALEETAASTPVVARDAAALIAVLAAAEAVLALVLAFRRDRPWIRAAWLSVPALAVTVVLARSTPVAALVAEPVIVDATGDGRLEQVLHVRIRAVRDGSGTLLLPQAATGPFAVIRFSADDRTVEEVSAGSEVRLSLRAGETRVVACRCWGLQLPTGDRWPGAGPAMRRWLGSRGVEPGPAASGVDAAFLPRSRDMRVRPGIRLGVADLPVK